MDNLDVPTIPSQIAMDANTLDCPNKELCGSCPWSETSYEDQLKKKLHNINAELEKTGSDYFKVNNILPSPKVSHYRNRMDFAIDYQGKVGLREKGKWWKVIDGHTCFIADEKIEELFKLARDWIKSCGLSYWDRKSYEGLLRYVVIRSTTLGQTMVNIVTGKPLDNIQAADLKNRFLTLSEVLNPTTLLWSVNHTNSDVSFGGEINTISGPGYIEEKINENIYRITPNAFFQTNPASAVLLQNTVLGFADSVKPKTVLDLYCGSGFFTIPLARKADKVLGIEMSAEAISDACANAQINNVSLNFRSEKAEDLSWSNFNPELLVVDPSRSGLHPRVLEEVMREAPKHIIYISCNYKKFAEEMATLSAKYLVTGSVAVDMFPQTEHVELVTLLNLV